ncbi:MAG TPA: hypothetical protein DDZ80_19580 [Cyanobacteria bacterium UBA8803]|nr:hypothetical protein [Cyanobacteria bacterium UBA9273]HBL60571.1 hypothetical protein [Cyanobacteria bacterium UBA8803]
MAIKNQEALDERANNLGSFNGIRLVLVSLSPELKPTAAILTVYFYNSNELSNIVSTIATNPDRAKEIFPITGGHRILGGSLTGQVQVSTVTEDAADDKVLHLTVQPIGDYSTYTLSVVYQNIDPIFSEIGFKFRPGCFNNCAPDWDAPPQPKQNPPIDYLAKDYDSFRHTLFAWMSNRVPGWQPTSEADLDQVLLSLFSVAADELSDLQDRVMNEAYWITARKRVSLARHARLMDYHIHQGNQANTWLALQVDREHDLAKGFVVWAGKDTLDSDSVVFITRQAQTVHPLLNQISLYTWSGTIPALAAGSTSADLKLSEPGQISAETVRNLIIAGSVPRLLIQEHLNPLTGETPGRDPTRRQLLQLISEETKALQDPVTGEWFVRVGWQEKDKLKRHYCFTVDCPTSGLVENVSLFHGNLVQVYHGRPAAVTFRELDKSLPVLAQIPPFYERTKKQEAICRLPDAFLAYQDTPPGGEVPPKSTLEVLVAGDRWDEVIDLIHSDDSDERGDRFVVETDELGRSLIRFGNGVNGKQLPEGAIVHCFYQVGRGLDGNVGADTLINFNTNAFPEILSCWNPFDVTNGREPEPLADILRRVPQAYRYHQLRAITLKDYENRAVELPEVSRAFAQYCWIGSWRTVQIAIDPVGTSVLAPEVREKVARHLEAVRLIGEDLEIRPPRFVPLDIKVIVCLHPDYWVEDIRFILEQEFSEGYTPDGRMAFFHPDRWTFGQALRVSQIIGAVQAIPGVAHVIKVQLKRWHEVTPGTKDVIEVLANEIIQVKNDPDHLESGFIKFEIKGGRQ